MKYIMAENSKRKIMLFKEGKIPDECVVVGTVETDLKPYEVVSGLARDYVIEKNGYESALKSILLDAMDMFNRDEVEEFMEGLYG